LTGNESPHEVVTIYSENQSSLTGYRAPLQGDRHRPTVHVQFGEGKRMRFTQAVRKKSIGDPISIAFAAHIH
jgi:hypothetical protein